MPPDLPDILPVAIPVPTTATSPIASRAVLPSGVPRLSVEAASTLGWERWVGDQGDMVGIDTFGASAPASVLAEKFGFTGAQVAARAAQLLQSQ